MKTELISNENKSIVRITRCATLRDQWSTGMLLDHAWLSKNKITYDEERGILTVKLRRHGRLMRALGRAIWFNLRPPKIGSVLTIKQIDDCSICDEDPDNPRRESVITGPLAIENDNTIFFGAFCEHENPFHMILKVRSIDISLEDI